MTPSAAKRMFVQERSRFARAFSSHPKMAKSLARTQFVLLDQSCSTKQCRYRDLAFAEPGRVSMLTRALDLPAENVRGLIRHELGHLADAWVDEPGREQRADDIAEWVSGQKIRYDDDDIQTVGRGKYPRPKHLHR